MRRVALGLVIAASACAPAGNGASDSADGFAEASYALPAHAPSRFGFGSEASADRIALWDIDIRSDGEGLPAGSGSVEEGRRVYETFCLECHGATGTEGPNDQLVGRSEWNEVGGPAPRTVGNYWQYPTTLFDFIYRAMPQLTPGLLTPEQTYAATAYLLYLNDIVPEDAVMDAETLPAVVMPARDRFVRDDREGGTGPIR